MINPRFIIWYEDESKYAGDPYNAPTTGVQVIVQEDNSAPQGIILVYSKGLNGYYCWRPDGGWFLTDEAGYWQYKLRRGVKKYMIYGSTMADTKAFYQLVERARQEGLRL